MPTAARVGCGAAPRIEPASRLASQGGYGVRALLDGRACNGGGGLWYNIGMDKLYRSSDEKVVAGVCAGLAHKLDLNANGLRCVVVLVTIFMTGIPLFVYAALWMILKERPTGGGVIDV